MTLNGIDIASWQAGINLSKLSTTDFIIVKATEATDYVNPYFGSWANKTLELDKLLGCYHFARPGDAIKQADYFLAKTKKYWGKAIMFLDWEENAVPLGPDWAYTWCERVFKKTGSKPMIYMSKSVCNDYDWRKLKEAGYDLWVAQYPDYNETGYKRMSQIWTDNNPFGAWRNAWSIFQYTSSGVIPGYVGHLDLDLYRYTQAVWRERAKGSSIKQTVSKVTTTALKSEKAKWEKMVNMAIKICKDNSHGYSQYWRWGPDYDCSSLMYYCADYAGYNVDMIDPRWTGSMIDDFTAVGFKKIKFNRSILRVGDILLSHNDDRQHTELYIGNGQTAGAHIASNGDIDDGMRGDQSGNEISVQDLWWTPDWILRPPDSGGPAETKAPSAPSGSVKYIVRAQPSLNVRTKRSVYSGKIVGSLKPGTMVYLKGVRKNTKGNTWGMIATGKYKGRYIAVEFSGETLAVKAGTSSILQVATEVIAGAWGNGEDRRIALEESGYDYEAIQKKVNELQKWYYTVSV